MNWRRDACPPIESVAEDTGLHESTVSRSTANKYVETPMGVGTQVVVLLGLKELMERVRSTSNPVQDSTVCESRKSAEALPDQAMQNMLAEEGVQIARRTITKYREVIGMAHLVTANEPMPINRWIETSRERLSCPVPLKLPENGW